MKNISIKFGINDVPGVAGRLDAYVEGDKASVIVNFGVLQDPRFFERFVYRRKPVDVPYLMSRICGVCSVVHLTCSTLAIEKALGIQHDEKIFSIREIAKGIEIIQNNLVHILMCVSDFTDAENVIDFSKKYPKLFNKMLKLNSEVLDIYKRIGGRFIHTPSIGATYNGKPVYKPELLSIGTRLEKLSDEFYDLAITIASIWKPILPSFKDVSPIYCVLGGEPYPLFSDKLYFSDGVNIAVEDYQKYIEEKMNKYSNAKYTLYKDKPFYTGSRARIEAYYVNLSIKAKDAVKLLNIDFRNPFENVKAQLVEIIHMSSMLSKMALELAENVEDKINPVYVADSNKISGEGVSAVSAPRGTLIHHYKVLEGKMVYANVITPTVMNARHVEVNGSKLIEELLSNGRGDEAFLKKVLSALLRAYDPCLPCAVH